MPDPFLSVVIPAYNEAQRLGPTLQRVHHFLATKSYESEIIVADDGSTDSTPELVREAARGIPNLRLSRHEPNRGKGFTVRRGVLEARGTYVLFSDADLSAPIEEVDKLLEALERAGSDAAIGSRALQRELIGVHQPWLRETAGRFFNLLVRLFTGLAIRDTQCGFKLFKRETTRRAFELQTIEGFGFDPELLFLIERKGGKLVEVPVRWNDSPATKVRFLRDATRMFADLVRIRWRALTGRYNF